MACDLTKGRKVPCKDVVGGLVRAWFCDFGTLGTVTETSDIAGVWGWYRNSHKRRIGYKREDLLAFERLDR